jgi:hypothetical protein
MEGSPPRPAVRRGQPIVVRSARGAKDRVVPLPDTLSAGCFALISRAGACAQPVAATCRAHSMPANTGESDRGLQVALE